MMRYTQIIVTSLLLSLLAFATNSAFSSEAEVQRELANLTAKLKRGAIEREIRAAGIYKLGAQDSVTVDDLRGIAIDDAPPMLNSVPSYCVGGALPPAGQIMCPNVYPSSYTDGYSNGSAPYLTEGYSAGAKAPYIAPGIQPFRFKYFNNTLEVWGWHSENFHDYGALHGFNIINPYRWLEKGNVSHYPAGTQLQKTSGSALHWQNIKDKSGATIRVGLMQSLGYVDGRYDTLPEDPAVLASQLVSHLNANPQLAAVLEKTSAVEVLMLDLEHPMLSSTRIRSNDCYTATLCLQETAWYPANATEDIKLEFCNLITVTAENNSLIA